MPTVLEQFKNQNEKPWHDRKLFHSLSPKKGINWGKSYCLTKIPELISRINCILSILFYPPEALQEKPLAPNFDLDSHFKHPIISR
jgi:hypothetical protein